MEREQVREVVATQTLPHESLEDVHVRVAVPLDDHRPVRRRRNVPADHDAVGEMPMRRDGESLGLVP
jgi:hypothetical protein